jgi:hypothetical protein
VVVDWTPELVVVPPPVVVVAALVGGPVVVVAGVIVVVGRAVEMAGRAVVAGVRVAGPLPGGRGDAGEAALGAAGGGRGDLLNGRLRPGGAVGAVGGGQEAEEAAATGAEQHGDRQGRPPSISAESQPEPPCAPLVR